MKKNPASLSERTRWRSAWRAQQTPWVNPKSDLFLRAELRRLKPWRSGSVLIPLAGNSPAVRLLYDLGMNVTAVEYVPEAVRALLHEQFPGIRIQRQKTRDATVFFGRRLSVRQGDFFKLPPELCFDLVYDRAAIVAIPPRRRRPYANILTRATRPGGALFAVGYEFIGGRRRGPPYSLSRAELLTLFPKPHWRLLTGRSKTYRSVEPRFAEKGVRQMRSFWVLLVRR